MSGVLEYVHGLASKVYEYCAEGPVKKKKSKLLTRWDFLLAVLLIAVSVFVLMQPQQPAKTAQGSPTTVAQNGSAASSATVVSSNPGMGGAQVSTDSPPCNTPGGPSCPPAPTGGCDQVGGPSCTPTAPANCNAPGGPSCTPTAPANFAAECQNSASSTACLQALSLSQSTAGAGDDWLTGKNGILFRTDPAQTVANDSIGKIWGAVNGTIFGFLGLLVVITGYRIMGGAFGFRYAEAIEVFPRIILAFIAASFSLAFVGLLIGLDNGLCQFVFDTAQKTPLPNHDYTTAVKPMGDWFPSFLAFLGVIFALALSAILFAVPGFGWVIGGVAAGLVGIGMFLLALQNLVLTLFSIMLAIQLFMRMIMINLYTVLGPWALALGALKEGAPVTKQWFKGLLSLIFVQLIQLICLTVGLAMFPKHTGDWSLSAGDMQSFVGSIATIWLTVRIPKVFGLSSLSAMMDAGQMASGVVMAGASAAGGFIGSAGGIAGNMVQANLIKKGQEQAAKASNKGKSGP